jgi:hypothetical protein
MELVNATTEFPENGSLPNTIVYRVTPIAHISPGWAGNPLFVDEQVSGEKKAGVLSLAS